MRFSIFLMPLAATSCATVPHEKAQAVPRFSAQAFFLGRTEGNGVLKTILASRLSVHVHGSGHVDADGTLVLDQTVLEESKKPETREWRIREVAPGRYAGTLTDAVGPVSGNVIGNLLHLRFRMKGGLSAEQRLYLAPDGRSAHNLMSVRKLGVVVATLDETIQKTG